MRWCMLAKCSASLKELIGEDFLTINPGEHHWQNRNEFIAGAGAFADHLRKIGVLIFSTDGDPEFRGCGGSLFAGTNHDGESGKAGITKLSLYGSLSEAQWTVGEYGGAR